jgi:hypothetical protein
MALPTARGTWEHEEVMTSEARPTVDNFDLFDLVLIT